MRHLLFSSSDTLKAQIKLPPLPEELPSNDIGEEVALITGATGFIGGFLLKEMLKAQTFKRYVCVVRAESKGEGLKRLKANLRIKGTDEEWIQRADLQIEIGDVLKPSLGINLPVYNKLLSEVDQFFHFAATMNWVTPFNHDTLSNIQSLRQVITFCVSGKLKKLHYASSMGIWTLLNHQKAPLLENVLHQQGFELPGGYFQSKWVNENILKYACESGVPVNIYRIGDVKGNSTNGLGDPQNFGNLVMQYFIKSGWVIAKEEPEFNFIPVDYLARAINRVCTIENNKTFQFSNPDLVSFADIYRAAKDVGHNVELLCMDEWMSKLMNETSDYGRVLKPIFKSFTPDPSLPQTSFYDIGVAMFKKTHDTSNTSQALRDTEISCPAMLKDGVLKQYMRHLGETVLS